MLVKYHPFLTTSFVYIWFHIVKQYKNTQVETFLMHPTFSSKGGFRIAINGITIYQVEKKKNQILPWIWDIGCFKQRQWYLAKMVLHEMSAIMISKRKKRNHELYPETWQTGIRLGHCTISMEDDLYIPVLCK